MEAAPVEDMVFTEAHAASLAGVSGEQIRAWVRQGFLVPSMKGEPPFSRLYSFRDVVALRTIAALSEQGVKLAQLARVWKYIHREHKTPWASLRFWLGPKKRGATTVYFSDPDGGQPLTADGTYQGGIPVALDAIADTVRKRAHELRNRPAETHGKIARSPHVLGNEPAFAGTRIPVRIVLAYLADGASDEEILTSYPTLTQADLDEARAYAMPRMRKRRVA